MDIWQSADPRRKLAGGWLGRALASVKVGEGDVPAFFIGKQRLPLAMQGPSAGVASLHPAKPFELQLSGTPSQDDDRFGRPQKVEKAAKEKLISRQSGCN